MGSHLDERADLEGMLRFSDTLRIDGRFRGTIESDGHLIVGEKAEIQATVRVASASVAGMLQGELRATARIEVFKGGKLFCNVVSPTIRIEDGAVFQGNCETTPGTAGPRPAGPLDLSQVSRKLAP